MKHLFAFLDRHPEFFFFVGAAGLVLGGILSEATTEIVRAVILAGGVLLIGVVVGYLAGQSDELCLSEMKEDALRRERDVWAALAAQRGRELRAVLGLRDGADRNDVERGQ